MTRIDSPRAAVRAFYERVWNRLESDLVPVLFHDGFSFRGSLGPVKTGHSEFLDYVDQVTGALGGYTCTIQDLVVEGDMAAGKAFAMMTFGGVHQGDFLGYAPTGKPVEWAGAALFTFSAGKIADLWVLGDVDGLKIQLQENAA